tara:strand:+ start:456 stop:689 length:234 start_codon:yes stop_codon:yes gene_type:complete
MSENQAQDRYNPPGTSKIDFERFSFGELEVNELFWLTESPNGDENVVHRKVNQNEAQQLKTREIISFKSNLRVFQKT